MGLKTTVTTKQKATPVSLTSVKAKSKVKTAEEIAAEELLMIHKHLEKMEVHQLLEKYEELKKKLQTFANENGDPDTPYTISTSAGTIQFSPRTKTLELTDKQKALDFLGNELALQLAKIGITDLRKHLTPVQLEQVAEEKRGSRSLKSVVAL